MRLLKALEKHVPSAQVLIGESPAQALLADPAEEFWHRLDLEKTETICVYGVSGAFYALAREWLDEAAKRRLVFVEESAEALAALLEHEDAILLLNDARVKIHFLETPLQVGLIAKKIAWAAVLRELRIVLLRPGLWGEAFEKELIRCHAAAHLILSDVSDYGISLLRNFQANSRKPLRSGLGLKGTFRNVPAVIVGAGPSLEKNGHLLSEFRKKGLILAGGSALNAIAQEPHFAASVDKEAPYRQFKMHPFSETPFCCQSRMSAENYSLIHGPALLFPDGNAPWINWINGQEEGFETGWTVGNFLTAFAVFLGCNPIVLVGMDLCYENERKYARIEAQPPEGLVQALDARGEPVWTQRDWLMAARWTEEFAARHPETRFINATEGGLGFSSPVDSLTLSSILGTLQEAPDLRKRVFEAIEAAPSIDSCRWDEWKASLVRCQKVLKKYDPEKIEGEIAFRKLLEPLWQIWKPVFERELELDRQPLAAEEKIKLNQALFFEQVLEEHLHELRS